MDSLSRAGNTDINMRPAASATTGNAAGSPTPKRTAMPTTSLTAAVGSSVRLVGSDAFTVPGITASDLPDSPEDRAALLQWAYFEAVTLVRQHGDVLERVRVYLAAGTSSVGETALMIDDMMC